MTGGVLGRVKVGYSLSSPVDWKTIPQLLDITFPTWVSDQIDSTTHGITKFKRTIPGMTTVSDMTLSLLWDPDETTTPEHEELQDLNVDGTTVWWRVEVAANREGTRWKPYEFQGYVKSTEPGTPMNDKDTLSVVVAFDGESFTRYPTTDASEMD